MNASYLANQSNSSRFERYLDLATEITNYGIPVVSAIGTLLQLTTITIFSSSWFEHKFYDFLTCRSICNLIVCLIGIFNKQVPGEYQKTEYLPLLVKIYLLHIPMRIAYLASAISDNLLILNRLATLYAWKTSIFNRLSKKVRNQSIEFKTIIISKTLFSSFKANVFICFALSIVAVAPFYFTVTVSRASDSPSETHGFWMASATSNNVFFRSYIAFMYAMETIIPLLTLIALNIVSLIKFNKIMETKRQLQQDGQRIDEAVSRFTRLILALSVICIFTRSFDTTFTFLYRVRVLKLISVSDQVDSLIIFFARFSYMLMIAEHGFDVLVYHLYDSNLRAYFQRNNPQINNQNIL